MCHSPVLLAPVDAVTLPEVQALVIDTPGKVGARLQGFWRVWSRLDIAPWIVSVLTHGYRLEFDTTLPSPPLSNSPSIISSYRDPVKQSALLEQFHGLIEKGAVEEVLNPTTPGFYSRVSGGQEVGGMAPHHRSEFPQRISSNPEIPDGNSAVLSRGDGGRAR